MNRDEQRAKAIQRHLENPQHFGDSVARAASLALTLSIIDLAETEEDGKPPSSLAERKANYLPTIEAIKQWMDAEKIKDELVKQLREES